MKYLVILFFLMLCSCATVKHKSISRTYFGTNGKGAQWIVWRMPYKSSGDSIIIHASGYNVSEQSELDFGVLYLRYPDGQYNTYMYSENAKGVTVKVPAGRFKIGFQPDLPSTGINTRFFRFNPGDSIALFVNAVRSELNFHEKESRYKTPKQRAREKRRNERKYRKLERIRAKNAKRNHNQEEL